MPGRFPSAPAAGAQLVNDDDLRCIEALIRGEQTALADLYDRYAPLMMAVGQKILGGPREAEDLLHDVFLEAWRCAKDFDPQRGSVRSWLVMRMRSRALDRVRASQRAKVVLNPDGETPDRVAPDPGPEATSDGRRVREAVGALSDDERPVLELVYFQGMTGAEVSQKLGLPLGTVKSRLARALAKLRSSMAPAAGAVP